MNLAVNEFARKTAANEFEILKKLGAMKGGSYLPKVHAFKEYETPSGAVLSMFTGAWLEGFHEFHFSGDNKKIVVWDPENHFFLTEDQAREAFRAAAGFNQFL